MVRLLPLVLVPLSLFGLLSVQGAADGPATTAAEPVLLPCHLPSTRFHRCRAATAPVVVRGGLSFSGEPRAYCTTKVTKCSIGSPAIEKNNS
jgi:hypothetical protein